METVKYCGKTHQEMDEILNTMCDIEEHIFMSKKEEEAFNIAIQCISTVMNRMVDNRPIEFD